MPSKKSSKSVLASGTVHKMPTDMKKIITSKKGIQETWNDLTPLGRNEYICWITSAKKPETREKRIKWMAEDIEKGKRRPCCWPGCPHRK